VCDLRSRLLLFEPGDCTCGHDSPGSILICVVEAVKPDRNEVRGVTMQGHVTFDVGIGEEVDNQESRLDSVEPLPRDVHKVMPGAESKHGDVSPSKNATSLVWTADRAVTPEYGRAALFGQVVMR